MLKEIADEFDLWAEQGRAESMARGHQSVTFQLLDRFQFQADQMVADVGCGNGWAVEEMLRRGAGSGIGVDLSPAMIEIANNAASSNAQYIVTDGKTLPILTASIDFLLSVESLYYHPDPLASLKEWKRVLKADGQVAIMVDLYTENVATHAWIDALSIPVHLLSIADYISLFEQAGFTNVSADQVQNKHPLKARSDFQVSPYWPSYEMYLSYRETGSLVLCASAGTSSIR